MRTPGDVASSTSGVNKECFQNLVHVGQTFLCRALITTDLFTIGSLDMVRRTRAHAYVISAGVNLYPLFDCTGGGGSGVMERSRMGMDVEASTTVSEVCASDVACSLSGGECLLRTEVGRRPPEGSFLGEPVSPGQKSFGSKR